MPIHDTAVTDVEINGQNAEQALKNLAAEAQKYKNAMVEAAKSNDLQAYSKAETELKKMERAMNQVRKASFDVNAVLKNLSGATLKDLQKSKALITRELEKMTRGTKEYIAASKNLQSVNKEIAKVKTEMNGAAGATQGFFSKASNGFNKYFGMATAIIASLTGVVFGVRKAIDTFNQFEKGLSNLSALTGLQGDDLKWLGEQAKQLSTSTTESGIKITSSATDIVEAYKLMGSAKPELLKNKEALNEVTKQALILKEAADMETGPAITALANIMNQFGADASQAGKYINVLAAGAKEGAAEIPDLADSIVRSGAAATSANISIEQEVGLIETLAEKGIKAERAGTGLRGTILKLQKGSDEFNPKVVGMIKALENLAAKNLSAKEMIELFGEENYTVAQILVNNRKRFDELTVAVTNTNVATEQAKINTSNNTAALEQAKNRAQLTAMTLGEKLAPALTFSTNSFSYFMKVILAFIQLFKDHGRLILTIASSIIAYTVAVKAQTLIQSLSNKESLINIAISKAKVIWDRAVRAGVLLLAAAKAVLTGNITRANAAMVMFNQTTKLNPFGILLAAIALVVVALGAYSKRVADINASQKMMMELNTQAKKSIAGERAEIEALLLVARDDKKSKDEKLAAIKRLNEISPDYLGNITLENVKTKDATTAVENYIKVLEKKALIQAAQEKLVEIEKQFIDLKEQGTGAELKWYQKLWNSISTAGEIPLMMAKNIKTITSNFSAMFTELADKKKTLLGIITEADVATITGTGTPEGGSDGSSGETNTPTPTTVNKEDERKKALEQSLSWLEEEYNQYKLFYQKQFLDEKISKKKFDEEMLANEMSFLIAKKALLTQFGQSTTDVSMQIAQKEIDIVNQKTDKKRKADKEYFDSKLEQLQREEEEIYQNALNEEQIAVDKMNRAMELSEQYGSSIGDAFGQLMSGQEDSQQQFAQSMIKIAFTALRSMVKIWVAQIFGTQLSTKGIAGIPISTVLSGILYGLVSAAESAVTGAMSKGSSDSSGKYKHKQRFAGNIDAVGADDGRTYHAPYVGFTNEPTYYPNTFIGSERGGEIVVDANRSRNIRMRYPALLEAIRSVPQHATGTLGTPSGSVGNSYASSDPQLMATIRQNTEVVAALYAQLRMGISARIGYDNLMVDMDKAQRAIDDVSRSA